MRLILSLLATMSVWVVSGCTTAITVQTNPAGGTVYARGSGRTTFKYERKGVANKPLTYESPYSADLITVVWTNEVKSVETRVPHLFKREASVVITPAGTE